MMKSMPLALLMVSTAIAAPPTQDSIATVLGPKAYRAGDVIEITDVMATSPHLEQGDSVTVRGRYFLKSCESARLCLYLTQTKGDGKEPTDAVQTMAVSRGSGEFTLKTTIKNQGALHLTFYDLTTGKPIGGTYFGTKEQMKAIAHWKVDYYLSSSEASDQPAHSTTEIECVHQLIEKLTQ